MGVRGLCNGLGPAAFGLMWHLFGIDIINTDLSQLELQTNLTQVYLGSNHTDHVRNETSQLSTVTEVYDISSDVISTMPGLPFLVSAFSVILALVLSVFLQSINVGADDVASDSIEETSSSNSQTAVNLCDDERSSNDANDS